MTRSAREVLWEDHGMREFAAWTAEIEARGQEAESYRYCSSLFETASCSRPRGHVGPHLSLRFSRQTDGGLRASHVAYLWGSADELPGPISLPPEAFPPRPATRAELQALLQALDGLGDPESSA